MMKQSYNIMILHEFEIKLEPLLNSANLLAGADALELLENQLRFFVDACLSLLETPERGLVAVVHAPERVGHTAGDRRSWRLINLASKGGA